MVIKRSDLLKPEDKDIGREVKTLEAEIDKTLKEEFEKNQYQYAVYYIKAGTSITALDKVMEAYKQAGWHVDHRCSIYAGRHIVFR